MDAGLITYVLSKDKVKVKVKSLSWVRLFATLWTHQAPPSMRFSWQEYWSGLPFPSPGDLPDPAIEPRSPTLQADALTSEPKTLLIWRWAQLNHLSLEAITKLCTFFHSNSFLTKHHSD